MNAAVASKGLGKGLQALMRDSYSSHTGGGDAVASLQMDGIQRIAVTALVAGHYQPRRHFAEQELQELADSIRSHGVMQPLLVRKTSSGFEIIAGERRWRAARLAELNEVPVIVRELTDAQALELGLIENIQRKDLNPLEEGAGYRLLMSEFGYTQERLAKIVGKSRSHVANLLRLESLPESIKQRIDTGELTMGHARALLSAKDPEELAEKIIRVGLSVRQTEALARGDTLDIDGAVAEVASHIVAKAAPSSPKRGRANVEKNEDVVQLEQMLSDSLGLKVSIATHSAKAGEVVIAYATLNELDTILQRLGSV